MLQLLAALFSEFAWSTKLLLVLDAVSQEMHLEFTGAVISWIVAKTPLLKSLSSLVWPILLFHICLWILGGHAFDFMYLLAMGLAKTPELNN